MQSVSSINLNKMEMRRAVAHDLKQLTQSERLQKSTRIQQKLQQVLVQKSGIWASFIPLASEPQLDWRLVSSAIQWCFPLIQENQLVFKGSVSLFQKNTLGFLEPSDGEIIPLSAIQGLIIPGLAFDRQGIRLGRGQGYYDRTLKNYKGSTVGVCFHTALKDFVPHEEHDLKCQLILTEETSVAVEGITSWN